MLTPNKIFMLDLLVIDPEIQSLIFLILIVLNIILLILFFNMSRRITVLLRGKDGKNLEESINQSSKDILQIALSLEKISQQMHVQEEMMAATIKKLGIVRFNPFNNTGGDQSFAIALLNSKNSGLVLSSLYLREGTRIYAKPVHDLKSNYPLSKEEEEAIKKAIE